MRFDAASMLWIRAHRRPALTTLLRAVTHTGTGKAWFLGAAVLSVLDALDVRVLPAQTTFLRAALTALLAWAIGAVVKRIVARPRPSETLADGQSTATPRTHDSFPSGHAAAAIAFFVALELVGHPWAHAVGVWSLAVTFSRFYLGVHYPSDLLGGAALGSLCGAGVLLARRFFGA